MNTSERRAEQPHQLARRRRALRWATELCDLPPALWRTRSAGAEAVLGNLDDDPLLADVIVQARALARSRPTREQVASQAGVGGLVVVAHGPTWSLVARSGGPVLVDVHGYPSTVLRVEAGPDRHDDLNATVAELIAASRGQIVP
jgi:hypothetical protein